MVTAATSHPSHSDMPPRSSKKRAGPESGAKWRTTAKTIVRIVPAHVIRLRIAKKWESVAVLIGRAQRSEDPGGFSRAAHGHLRFTERSVAGVLTGINAG